MLHGIVVSEPGQERISWMRPQIMERRDMLRLLATGASAGAAEMFAQQPPPGSLWRTEPVVAEPRRAGTPR